MAKYYRATQRGRNPKYSSHIVMGKKFRTKAGRYGCYVYVDGVRSHFEEQGSQYARVHKRR